MRANACLCLCLCSLCFFSREKIAESDRGTGHPERGKRSARGGYEEDQESVQELAQGPRGTGAFYVEIYHVLYTTRACVGCKLSSTVANRIVISQLS